MPRHSYSNLRSVKPAKSQLGSNGHESSVGSQHETAFDDTPDINSESSPYFQTLFSSNGIDAQLFEQGDFNADIFFSPLFGNGYQSLEALDVENSEQDEIDLDNTEDEAEVKLDQDTITAENVPNEFNSEPDSINDIAEQESDVVSNAEGDDTVLDQEVDATERVIENELEDESEAEKVEAQPMELASDGEASSEPAATEADAEAEAEAALQTWRANIRASSGNIPQPSLGGSAQAGERVRSTGSRMRAARAPARRAVGAQARSAVSPSPHVDNAPPKPPPGPVPAANRLVKSKSDRRLPSQSMPDLQASPAGTQPRRGDRPVSETTERGSQTRELVLSAQRPSGVQPDSESPDQEHAQQVRDTSSETANDELRESTSEGVELVDEPPQAPEPLPRAAKSAISSVLSRLLANPQEHAEQIITEARKSAYSNETLEHEFPNIGNSELPNITESLTTKLQGVAREAGIASTELDAVVERRNQELRAQQEAASEDVNQGRDDACGDVEEGAQEETDAIAGAREVVDEHTIQQYEAAGGNANPELINRRRDQQQSRLNRLVGRQRAAYTQAKDRRVRQITQAASGQVQAYRAVVQTDVRSIRRQHEGKTGYQLQQLLISQEPICGAQHKSGTCHTSFAP